MLESGLALAHERVAALKTLANGLLREPESPVENTDSRRLDLLLSNSRGLLDDLAREKGERAATLKINHRLIAREAERVAAELGMDVKVVFAEAERLVKEQK